mmetsp:Transcript_25066/g.37485  ORF Transcript_25066/g.37485 Transcript_25066/m.37485 type:complete len:484 (+) Transcript_25066:1-1452(+)
MDMDMDMDMTMTTTSTTTCPICNNHETRYTCPKCLTPFCSVECYRKHDLPKQEGDNDDSGVGGGGGMCTEHFYRQKVKEVCDLDVRTDCNVSQMKDILTRSFYDSPDDYDGSGSSSSNNNVGNRHGGKGNELTEEELVELATHVLSIEDLENEKGGTKIQEEEDLFDYNKIPEHLRLKFEQAVQRGDLSHLIKEWHPYWLPDYKTTKVERRSTEESFYDEDECNGHIETLDEKLLSIQKLVKLQKTSSSKRIKLQYNICELLYITAIILRLYNGGRGTENINYASYTDGNVGMNSAHDLYSQSLVLSRDERYKNINEVFMDCVIHKKNDNNGIDWKVLMNDSICICRNKRMVMRVLFDTIDILNDGLKSIKKIELKNSMGKYDIANKKKEIKLAKKKVEYYILWTASNWDLVANDIVNDIKEWMDDWISKEEDRMNVSSTTIMGNIAATKGTFRQKAFKLDLPNKRAEVHSEPLLRAVSTKKK